MNWITALLNLLKQFTNKPTPTPTPPTPIQVPVPAPAPTPKPDFNLPLYRAAVAALGKDISLKEDELGCAESVSYLLHNAYGDFPNEILGTALLNSLLVRHPKFRQTLEYKPGVVIVSPTIGTTHGHTGIFGTGKAIMSNTSSTSKWTQNYTVDGWVKYFKTGLGLHVYYYERIG